MLTRFARRVSGRILTGPVPFLVAGVVDICCALVVLGRVRLIGVSGELSGFGYVFIGTGPRDRMAGREARRTS